jgi:hypothetical protein
MEDNIKRFDKELMMLRVCIIDVCSSEYVSGDIANTVMNLLFPQNVRDVALSPDSRIGVPASIAG